MNPNQHCAFIEFENRMAAENVIKKYQSSIIINGVFLKIAWAKPIMAHDSDSRRK